MRVPSNVITSNQYTSGKELMFLKSYKEYIGPYYILNDRYFAGKEYNNNAPELIKIKSSQTNVLLTRPDTYVYGFLSKKTLKETKVRAVAFNPTDEDYQQGFQVRYFAKKVNVVPVLIKEISKETFLNVQQDPFYQTTQINFYFRYTEEELNAWDKQMPGLKTYLSEDIVDTSSEDDNQSL